MSRSQAAVRRSRCALGRWLEGGSGGRPARWLGGGAGGGLTTASCLRATQ